MPIQAKRDHRTRPIRDRLSLLEQAWSSGSYSCNVYNTAITKGLGPPSTSHTKRKEPEPPLLLPKRARATNPKKPETPISSFYYVPKCGAFNTNPIRTPASVPAIGIVKIHESSKSPTRWKLTAFKVPLQSPTPTVAPVMHIEVETGREYCENSRTVIAAPISIEEPRGEELS